mmetsp:Transcript_40760/g.65534  ORF Transcript_40760/g.65534 Transcript_40760/m.65534 type:complete len:200 (-) Transcript_40760:45-644(-)
MIASKDDGSTSNPFVRSQSPTEKNSCIARSIMSLVEDKKITVEEAEKMQCPYYLRTRAEVREVLESSEIRNKFELQDMMLMEVPITVPPSASDGHDNDNNEWNVASSSQSSSDDDGGTSTSISLPEIVSAAELFWGIHENCIVSPLIISKRRDKEEKEQIIADIKDQFLREMMKDYATEGAPALTLDAIMISLKRTERF